MKYRIDYRDRLSSNEWRSTYYVGEVTEEFLIDFFGLQNEDVTEYRITLEND